jgi:hypothetical protein
MAFFDGLLLNKVRVLGRLGLWGLGGGWDFDTTIIILLTADFLNNFFTYPHKIIASKGGLTHHLNV